jgi:hypothetical protein
MNSIGLSVLGGIVSIGIGWFDKQFLSGNQSKDKEEPQMSMTLALRYFLMGFGVSYVILLASSYFMDTSSPGSGSAAGGNEMEDITDTLLNIENVRESFSVGRPKF